MTISDLINQLMAVKCAHGDVEVLWQACTGKAVPAVVQHGAVEGAVRWVEVAPKVYPC